MKRPPRKLNGLINCLIELNGLISRWQSEGYSGDFPEPLLNSIEAFNTASTKFLENYKGKEIA